MSSRVWDITICCPRPMPRVSVGQQAWHLDPERVQRTVNTFCAPGSSITLTSRTVRLRTTVSGEQLGGYPDRLERTLGVLLSSLYFDTGRVGHETAPSPVRFDIRERPNETSPSKGDQVT